MRITLEGTEPIGSFGSNSGLRVVILIRGDGLMINQVRDELLKPMLLAWGYQPESVRELFVDDIEETVKAERRPHKNAKKGVS